MRVAGCCCLDSTCFSWVYISTIRRIYIIPLHLFPFSFLDKQTTHNMADSSATTLQQQQKTYKQAASDYYNQKYETWMPWIEDQYLKWFTKDNKVSYATKRTFCLISIYLHTYMSSHHRCCDPSSSSDVINPLHTCIHTYIHT